MKLAAKVIALAVTLAAVLTLVGVSVAKAAPQPRLARLVHSAVVVAADQVGGKAAVGKVACAGPVEKYTYICTVHTTGVRGGAFCRKYYIAWKGGNRQDFIPWSISWACKAKPAALPPIPYGGVNGPTA